MTLHHQTFESANRTGNYHVTHLGGEVFRATAEGSKNGNLWGELFRDKERNFLRTNLQEERLCFSVMDTFQILCRVLWRPEARRAGDVGFVPPMVNGQRMQGHHSQMQQGPMDAMGPAGRSEFAPGPGGMPGVPGMQGMPGAPSMPGTKAQKKGLAGRRRQGKFVLLLHEVRGPLTTSWTWIKFAKPLYQAGYSVILMDLPGLGRSQINQKLRCDPDTWISQDWHIVSECLDHMGVEKVNIVAVGEACNTVLRLLQRSPHQSVGEHIFYNPVITQDTVFPPVSRAKVAQLGVPFEECQMISHCESYSNLLRSTSSRIWAIFDKKNMQNTLKSKVLCKAIESQEIMRTTPDGSIQIVKSQLVSDIGDDEIATCKVGVHVDDHFLFPSRLIRARMAQFLAGEGPMANPDALSVEGQASRGVSTSSNVTASKLRSLMNSASAPDLGGASGSTDDSRSRHTVKKPKWERDNSGRDSRIEELCAVGGDRVMNLVDAEAKAARLLVADARASRYELVTRHARRLEEQEQINPHLDRDLLAEEHVVMKGILADSIRSAKQEMEKRKKDALEKQKLDEAANSAALPKGVLRYMRTNPVMMMELQLALSGQPSRVVLPKKMMNASMQQTTPMPPP
eukprot:TRINITY_DN24753_c0_g1_i1.p1 TRINITY_DN24753_c0_g1~~TRINITY_DN24753_c0_g1_i1.p1  ORF type:complete len:626 (-),score=102.18 TRINITY_DN24753_c0_g1_i1:177-2054(-)